MREARPIERDVGMAYYLSEHEGTGGRLRARPEDFRVRELERFETEALAADPDSYPHLVCRVTLRGWDTFDFARALSNRLGISRERVDWAGTKDKRAVSTQLFSIRGRELALGDLPSISNAEIEALGRAGRGLRFGDLAGNAFCVVVRDPVNPKNVAAITEELRALGVSGGSDAEGNGERDDTETRATIGVPNYFGQQRFGSRRPVTHEVGLAIVRGDWEDAVLEYVANPRATEPDETQAARRFVAETRDWQKAVGKYPSGLRYERAICGRLAEREAEVGDGNARTNDSKFRAALDVLPRNLQRLFVNAAQSYLFNRIVTERLARDLPLDRAVAGDVVCFTDRNVRTVRLPDVGRTQRANGRRVETVNRHCARGRAFVTAPLVGTETEFSGGEPGEVERAVLDGEGLTRADFDLPEPYCSSGTRRAVCLRTAIEVTDDPLRFAFSLPKGSYATTLLREYLKVEPTDLA